MLDRPTSADDPDDHNDTANRTTLQKVVKGNDQGEIPFESDPISYNKYPSHVWHSVTLDNCGDDRPLVPEVLSMVEEILYAMRRQRKRVPPGESLQNFHHILPVCLLHSRKYSKQGSKPLTQELSGWLF